MKKEMKLKKKGRESYLATVGEVRRFSQQIDLCTYVQWRIFGSNYNNLALPSVFSISFTGI